MSRIAKSVVVLCVAGLASCGHGVAEPELAAVDDGEVLGDGEVIDGNEASFSEPLDAAEAAAAAACAVNVNNKSQLLITGLPVVNDPVRTKWTGSLTSAADGAWHFGKLMTQMAGPNNPNDFVRTWLAQWQSNVTVNGQVVPARQAISQIINAWPKLSNGKLDLTKAPFRLLAIVNRFDLRSSGNAGEGRFVFGVLGTGGAPLQFTVILEYKMLAPTASDVKAWAHLWRDLSTSTFGSSAYLTKLQTITNKFAAKGAGPGRPNGSAISQVRTNEIALASPWELREFRLTSTGQLRMAPVALTPVNHLAKTLNNSSVLASFMNANATAIKAQTHQVPLLFQNSPFRAAATTNSVDFWKAPGVTDSLLRHRFSINTCNGCHGQETKTSFLHVVPRAASSESKLSAFMNGVTVNDPVTGVPRTMNELASRNAKLKAFLCANP